jgi:hypothetical protein
MIITGCPPTFLSRDITWQFRPGQLPSLEFAVWHTPQGGHQIYPVGFQKLVTICRSSGLFAKRTMNSIFGQEQPQFTCVPPKSRNVAPPILVRSCNCYFWNIVLESSNPIQIKSNQGRWIDSDWSSWHPTSDSSGLLCSSPAGAKMGQEGPIIGNHIYQSSRPISCDDDPFHPYAMMILNHIHIWYGHGGFLSHGATPSSHPIFGIFHENQAQRAETAALYLRATSWSIWPGISWI